MLDLSSGFQEARQFLAMQSSSRSANHCNKYKSPLKADICVEEAVFQEKTVH